MIKKQLKEYQWLKKNITILISNLEVLRIQAECKSHNLSNRSNSTAVDIVEIEQLLKQKILESHKILEEIENCIEDLPELEKCIMRLRYISGMKWEDISLEVNYSLRQTKNIHEKALQKTCQNQ